MDKKEELKKGLEQLVKEAIEIYKLAKEVETDTDLGKFGMEYQNWYTRALRVVEILSNDRLEEFVGYYKIDPKRKELYDRNYVIQDFIMGTGAATDFLDGPSWDTNAITEVYRRIRLASRSLSRRIMVSSLRTGPLIFRVIQQTMKGFKNF